MKITAQPIEKLKHIKTDLLVLGVFANETEKSDKKSKKKGEVLLSKSLEDINKALDGHLIKSAHHEGFEGKIGQKYLLSTLGKIEAKYVLLVGLGTKKQVTQDIYRKAAGSVFKAAHTKRLESIAIELFTDDKKEQECAIQAVAEGCFLAAYRFDKYLTEDKQEDYVKHIQLLTHHKAHEAKQAIDCAKAISDSVCYARDLVNEPPSILNPSEMAKRAEHAGKAHHLTVNVLDEKALAKENLNLLLAVGRASAQYAPPRMVRIAYRPTKAKKHIVLVGKGVTFDTGGLDIKPPAGMLDMKTDMAGSAAVLATLLAVAKLKPHVAVTGYMGLVENGIGSRAYHPSDIITSRKGLTVEIDNTDAEGRLVLADVLDYAQEKDKPDILIDLATLTGACMVALGPTTAGVFTDDEDLCKRIKSAGKECGEDFWQLPLNSDLNDQLKSPVADLKNCGDRWGGSITAALFLKRFIHEGVTWAHLDIAGPATCSKDHPYMAKGGSGFAVRTLIEMITKMD